MAPAAMDRTELTHQPRLENPDFSNAFANAAGIYHLAVNISGGKRATEFAFHIQNVNAYHSRLKGWMRRFNGVATKYLPNYLGWRRVLDRHNGEIPPDQILSIAVG